MRSLLKNFPVRKQSFRHHCQLNPIKEHLNLGLLGGCTPPYKKCQLMNWNLPRHSYEELREIVIDVLLNSSQNGVNQFAGLLEHVARALAKRHRAPALPTGMAYPGADSQLHANDANLILEIVWDLFRQGIITLGFNTSNPGWPWLRLSRFGMQTLQNQSPYRFHDTSGFLRILQSEVPDIAPETIVYVEEAVAAFYADCLLSTCVMLGVAAENEFLRLLEVASANPIHGSKFQPILKVPFIRTQIVKCQDALKPVVGSLSKATTEDLDTNLNSIQSVIRIARNEAGHPSGGQAPTREQVYVFLQLFIPFAKQLMRLRNELGQVGTLGIAAVKTVLIIHLP
jgi:hypothetical protein